MTFLVAVFPWALFIDNVTSADRWYHFQINKTVIGPINSTSITRLSLKIYIFSGACWLFNHRNLCALLEHDRFSWSYHKFQIISPKLSSSSSSLAIAVLQHIHQFERDHQHLKKRNQRKTKLVNFSSSSYTTRNNNHQFLAVVCVHVPPPIHSFSPSLPKKPDEWINVYIYFSVQVFSVVLINEVIIIFIYARSNKTFSRCKTKCRLHHAMKYFLVSLVWRKFDRKVVSFISTFGPDTTNTPSSTFFLAVKQSTQ